MQGQLFIHLPNQYNLQNREITAAQIIFLI